MKNTIQGYIEDILRLSDGLSRDQIADVCAILLEAYREKRQIFVAGNGGSAGTANHFCCDFGKNAVKSQHDRPRILSLSANIEVVTALGNDFCYGDVFLEQLKNLMNDGDVILLISASGNSENVVRAAEYVRSRHGKVIGFTGFSGGRLGALSDVEINVPSTSYEEIEDIHLMLTHIVVCAFKSMRLGEGWEA